MTKEEIKQRAEKVATALGYDTSTLSLNVINVCDSYCMGFVAGQKEGAKEDAIEFQKFVERNYHPFLSSGRYMIQYKFEEGTPWPDLSTIKTYSPEELYDFFHQIKNK